MNNIRILAHIVGVTSLYRSQLIEQLHNLLGNEVAILDIDKTTAFIKNSPQFQKVVRSGNLKEIKDVWRVKFSENLNRSLKNVRKSKVILIGSSCYLRYASTIVIIPASLKIVLKYKPEQYAKELIIHYLNKYHDAITNGEFPLKYLDFKYLIAQYNRLVSIYEKKNYLVRREGTLIKLINYASNKATNIPDFGKIKKLYLCSDEQFENYIRPSSLTSGKIIAYTQEWLATLSVIPFHSKLFKKGFMVEGKKLTPFLKELKKNAFINLNKNTFLYQVEKSGFGFKDNSERGFKLISQQPVKIIRRTKIVNIYKKLTQKKVKFIPYA